MLQNQKCILIAFPSVTFSSSAGRSSKACLHVYSYCEHEYYEHTLYVGGENSAEKQKSYRKADEKEASEQNSTHLLHL